MKTVVLTLFAFSGLVFGRGPDVNFTVEELSLNVSNPYTFNNTMEYAVSVKGLPSDMTTVPARVNVRCENCSPENPAIVIFKEKAGVATLQLPYVIRLSNGDEVLYNETERTLCWYKKVDRICQLSKSNVFDHVGSSGSTLLIELSTSSKSNVTVNLLVTLVSDFLLNLDQNKTFTITPSNSALYMYTFSGNVSSVILKQESEQDNCMIVSIENVTFPAMYGAYMHKNVFYQTVSRLGAITITKEKFPCGFYVSIALCPDDAPCRSPIFQASEKMKTVVVTLFETMSANKYVMAISWTLAGILVIYVTSIAVAWGYFMRGNSNIPVLMDESNRSCHIESTSTMPTVREIESDTLQSPLTENTLSMNTDSSMDEDDYDTVNDMEEDKNIFRTKTFLCLSDLAKKNPTVLKKKSNLYLWNLTTVAIFYILPASQLVYTDLYNMNQSGDLDLCYYNFLCSHPLWKLEDFNHFFSNIGYVSLGLLFIILTRRKEVVHMTLLKRDGRLDREYGVPQHFGLFYAMGTSLIIEGILSACYHLCPNMYSFQYDSSFMYIISVLCMIKIYQSRHPDVNATAYSTFLLIAFVLLVVLFGAFSNLPHFWMLFSVLDVTVCFYISLKIYYVGRVEINFKSIVRELRFRCHSTFLDSLRPQYPTRFALLAVINVCNWSLAAAAITLDVRNIFSYLLTIFIANLTLYTLFYIIMKFISGEKIGFQPSLYILLSIASWSFALYYFHNKTMSWRESPAQSRVRNRPCALFDFYDNHDIWHFISAGALFFSFMVLLTLDDDLVFVHRSQIPVF